MSVVGLTFPGIVAELCREGGVPLPFRGVFGGGSEAILITHDGRPEVRVNTWWGVNWYVAWSSQVRWEYGQKPLAVAQELITYRAHKFLNIVFYFGEFVSKSIQVRPKLCFSGSAIIIIFVSEI